jgi:hypothetical protein
MAFEYHKLLLVVLESQTVDKVTQLPEFAGDLISTDSDPIPPP